MAVQPLDEEEIFNVARKIESQDLRRGYLDEACGGNTALSERVRALLRVRLRTRRTSTE